MKFPLLFITITLLLITEPPLVFNAEFPAAVRSSVKSTLAAVILLSFLHASINAAIDPVATATPRNFMKSLRCICTVVRLNV